MLSTVALLCTWLAWTPSEAGAGNERGRGAPATVDSAGEAADRGEADATVNLPAESAAPAEHGHASHADRANHAEPEQAEAAPRRPGLRAWLTRPRPRSARFLDHGVLALSVAGGTPHLYRLDLRVGLLDLLSLGFTTHWLPGQRAPQIWPVAALALWRGRVFEVGAHYRPVLHPPVDPSEHFVPRTHFALASFVLSSGWISGGLDAGFGHARVASVDPGATLEFTRRSAFAGGVFARVGTRRWGVSADALALLTPDPLLVFELAVDLRFGAFERRPPGGWTRP
ncbi:hypothetical protein G6O69_13160 [Pseudenhygromyxa sp. WMMC2535]|uniref:hypothetical protein n=1 Tax=Pseudenhygromyxa sp. WMMC2535 TaxID=2712867 RepID=UPI001552BED3|nr:hypothetical protein [Pseudenhygromyxa sp. WMMC2535]NVB38783.1 hypothetical protein [Pseudenhygromyxa sp. WMMC2535]